MTTSRCRTGWAVLALAGGLAGCGRQWDFPEDLAAAGTMDAAVGFDAGSRVDSAPPPDEAVPQDLPDLSEWPDMSDAARPPVDLAGPYVVQGLFVGGHAKSSGGAYEVRGVVVWQAARLTGGSYQIEGRLR